MKINFRELLAATLMISGAIFSGCVDSDKNYYDPSYRAPNPMGSISAPNGFDWLLFSSINLNVKVNDTFNGQYHYTVEVFDNNPVISPDAILLTKGFAKLSQDFTTELPVSNSIPTLYIRQTAPDGLASIRAYSTENNSVINCDFSTPVATQATRSMSTRAFVTMTAPDSEDKKIFPEASPTNEIFDQENIKTNGRYKVTAKTTQLKIEALGVSLYVTEDITLSREMYLAANCKLFILPNVTVTMPQSKNNGQSNCLISIGKGATLRIENDMQLDSNYKLYNLGTLTAKNIAYTNSSFVYNGENGIMNISGKLTGTNVTSNMLNEGKVTATDIAITGGSHIKNINSVTVAQMTNFNSTNGSWENEGEWITTNMHIEGWNDYNINKCKLIVNQLLDLHEAKIINDAGAFIKTGNMYMNNTLIELGAKSMFVVEEQVEYKYHTSNRGFKGTGNEKALLKIKKAVAIYPDRNDMIHYSGNMQIVCNEHPEAIRDLWNARWTMTGGAEWASESANPVEIAKSECSEGSVTSPLPPTEPEFPTITESANKYTLLFEDQWPLYGDYDMNDIVIQLKGLKYELDSKNKTNKVTFTVTLHAVGATKAIAAAVMLDKVPVSSIESIVYKDHTPTTFDLQGSGVEAGQSHAVIPLFDDAHKLMGKNTRGFINTQSGSNDNVKNSDLPDIEITVNLTESIEESAFNINNLNFFIITDRAQLRKEIHMPGRQPSDLANTQLFGGNDDGSLNAKYYISKENLAWGIIVPQSFKWPLEYHNIKDVYKEFEGWVTSGGTENRKWYNSFDNDGTFQNNKN